MAAASTTSNRLGTTSKIAQPATLIVDVSVRQDAAKPHTLISPVGELRVEVGSATRGASDSSADEQNDSLFVLDSHAKRLSDILA